MSTIHQFHHTRKWKVIDFLSNTNTIHISITYITSQNLETDYCAPITEITSHNQKTNKIDVIAVTHIIITQLKVLQHSFHTSTFLPNNSSKLFKKFLFTQWSISISPMTALQGWSCSGLNPRLQDDKTRALRNWATRPFIWTVKVNPYLILYSLSMFSQNSFFLKICLCFCTK